jgi:glucoamylase
VSTVLSQHPATGGPGIPPRWARSDKDCIGTAYSGLSRVWFTVSRGVIEEVCYPTIDRPQIRDLQLLVTDGASFFHDTRRHMDSVHEHLAPDALGFRITSTARDGHYRILQEVIADPHQTCILAQTRLEADAALLPQLRLFALLAPHLEVGGWGNTGNVVQTAWGSVLTAHKGGTWLALGATVPFLRTSCGYVGTTDGWQDLSHNYQMDWEFDCATDGNIALTGELHWQPEKDLVLGLAFGDSLHKALMTLLRSLSTPFAQHRQRFLEQWQRANQHLSVDPAKASTDGGRLYRASHSLILAHEDKTFAGATIASLSTPWGEAHGDDDLGGYHLVWTRDLCNSATGLLAAGTLAEPLRALIYLACTQRDDGGFYQNFWIDGEPYWHGIQLDEVSFPIMLAWRLHKAGALEDFDPWPMVLRAAGYLVEQGPATPQERWEENSGYSPSTLAANIAGLICAAAFARERGHGTTAQFLEEYADFLEAHVDRWTVTTEGTLVPGIRRHFIRLHPMDVTDPHADEDANHGTITIRNQPPGAPTDFPAKEIVDAGFLELVRYGIRKAGDPLLEDSLRVIDAVLKVDTPSGPCWRRYNHDGYGQQSDGGPFVGYGYGHAWPLLIGERAHYELAAGRDIRSLIQTLERFASATCLLPEQVWTLPDVPQAHMYFGQPTGSSMPLLWAHGEYIKLVRSTADGRVFDRIPEVEQRYLQGNRPAPPEVWKFNRQVQSIAAGTTLRVQAGDRFQLRWTLDEWRTVHDTTATTTVIGTEFVDIAVPAEQQAPVRFTFYWTNQQRWEGRDFATAVVPAAH